MLGLTSHRFDRAKGKPVRLGEDWRSHWPPLPRLDRAQRVERSLATFILSIRSKCQVYLKSKSTHTISPKEKPELGSSFCFYSSSSFFLVINNPPLAATRVSARPATDSTPVFTFGLSPALGTFTGLTSWLWVF